MPNVIMVTTKWKKVTTEEGEQREEELKADFWRDMIADGCGTARFDDTYESAWRIIGSLVDKRQAPVLLPREIVDFDLRLNETQAGIALNKELEQLIKGQKETDRKLRELARSQNNELVVQKLNKQRAEIEVKIRKTEDQLRTMKIPFTRRIRLFFKSRSYSI